MLIIKNIIPSLSVQVSESNHKLTDDTSFFLVSLQFYPSWNLEEIPLSPRTREKLMSLPFWISFWIDVANILTCHCNMIYKCVGLHTQLFWYTCGPLAPGLIHLLYLDHAFNSLNGTYIPCYVFTCRLWFIRCEVGLGTCIIKNMVLLKKWHGATFWKARISTIRLKGMKLLSELGYPMRVCYWFYYTRKIWVGD